MSKQTTGLPILKWVGGKTRLLPVVLPHYTGQQSIVEPFFGGGAVSFALAAQHPHLEVVANDFIEPLIAIYETVRDGVEDFIVEVDRFADPYLAKTTTSRREYYYNIRQQYMEQTLNGPAPLFFMLWCAYSGMYRTGKKFPGRFNTSHGFGQEKKGFYHPDRLRAASLSMQKWSFSSGDFMQTQTAVTGKSFVFLDPPYRGTYGGYTDEGFSEKDQLRVVEFFKTAASKGASVVYTNKYTDDGYYEDNFPGFTIQKVPIKYQVNRNCADVGRPVTFEAIISTTPPSNTMLVPGATVTHRPNAS